MATPDHLIVSDDEREGEKIRPANFVHPLTDAHLREIRRCMTDIVYFTETYVKIRRPGIGYMAFRLFEYQKKLLRLYAGEYGELDRIITMMSRQSGKSTTAAAFLLWYAIFHADEYVMILSKDQSASDDIMRRLWFAYEELPWFLKPGVTKNDIRTKDFDNGTRVTALATTPSTGRGRSVSLLYLDEFAFVKPSIAKEFWAAVSPTLSTGGKCIITSTPQDDESVFARIWFGATLHPESYPWSDGDDDLDDEPREKIETIYETDENREIETEADTSDMNDVGFVSFYVPWTAVPDKVDRDGKVLSYRGEDYKRRELSSGMSLEMWKREYECVFGSSAGTLINGAKLAALRHKVHPPRFVDRMNVRWYERPIPNSIWLVSMDPSGDGKGDACAIEVVEVPSMVQIAEWHDHGANQNEQTKVLLHCLRKLESFANTQAEQTETPRIYYSVERNAVGMGIIRAIENIGEDRFPGVLVDGGVANGRMSTGRGLVTTNRSKTRYAHELKNMIENNILHIRSKHLLSELQTFVKSGPSWGARDGNHDDLVMAMILNCMLMDEVRYYEPDLDDILVPDMQMLEMEQEEDAPLIPL